MKQMSDLQAAVLAKPGSKVTCPVSDSTLRTSKPCGLSVPVTRGSSSTPSSYFNWKSVTGPPGAARWGQGASLPGRCSRQQRGACLEVAAGPPLLHRPTTVRCVGSESVATTSKRGRVPDSALASAAALLLVAVVFVLLRLVLAG